jgi:AcrR family transcriptional regulator
MSASSPLLPNKPVRTTAPRSTGRAADAAALPGHKGQQTKAAIIDAALGLATQIGLQGLSIGVLAEVMRMSKSGVFAHFGSREELQISVIREYHVRFEQEVFASAMTQARGLPRLRALFENWMSRTSVEIDSGCLYISGAVEFDDIPGPVRDALADSVKIWLAAMHRAVVQAKQAGHLQPEADEQQMAFEIHGLILALHYEARFLQSPESTRRAHTGFKHILERFGIAGAATAPSNVTLLTSSLLSTKPRKVSKE